MNYPYNITDHSISVFFEGKLYTISSSDGKYEPLKKLLIEGRHDRDLIDDALNVAKKIERVTSGDVVVCDNEVLYRGEPVHGVLVDKLLRMLDEGADVKPWVRFLDNLMKNPSFKSRKELYGFLETWNAPITSDGHFIAFKMVNRDYTDNRTGKLDNSIGRVVNMPRDAVDDDSRNTCSYGLHVCSPGYLNQTSFGPVTLALKVNPRDVVSIPVDYNNTKMRVCQYEVVADVSGGFDYSGEVVDEYDHDDDIYFDDADDENDWPYDENDWPF